MDNRRILNRSNVTKRIYNVAVGPDGKPILDAKGKPTLLGPPVAEFRTELNNVKQAMLGREIYWLTQRVQTEPVNSVVVSYASGASTEYCPTEILSSTTAPYATVWQTTFTNGGTAAVVIDTHSLIHYTGVSADIIYCTDEDLSITVNPNQAEVIEWEHVWSAGDDVVQNDLLNLLQSAFEASHISYPVTTVNFLDSSNSYEALGTPVLQSGGTVNDTQVVWTARAENADGEDHTLDTIKVENITPGRPFFPFIATGLSVTWKDGKEVACTITYSVAELGAAEVDEAVAVTDGVGVDKTGTGSYLSHS